MARIMFIDDDSVELQSFSRIVAKNHDCSTVLWPKERGKLGSGIAPELIVSDLYLPSSLGDTDPTEGQKVSISESAKAVSGRFLQLSNNSSGDEKARLREMMAAISAASEMLKQQWTAMGQSPDNGVHGTGQALRLWLRQPAENKWWAGMHLSATSPFIRASSTGIWRRP